MKKMFLALLIIPSISFCQKEENLTFPIDSISGKINFSEVVQVDTTDATKLYSRSRLFVANAFKNAKSVTQLEDEQAKTVVGKGEIVEDIRGLGSRGNGYVSFKFTIQSKDNRYRYSFTDFQHHAASSNLDGGPLENEKSAAGGMMFPKKFWNDIKQDVAHQVDEMVRTLKKYMLSDTGKSDW